MIGWNVFVGSVAVGLAVHVYRAVTAYRRGGFDPEDWIVWILFALPAAGFGWGAAMAAYALLWIFEAIGAGLHGLGVV